MNQNLRKCKGVNTARDYKGCGERKHHHRFGLCTPCFINWLNTTPEGIAYKEKMTIKAKKENFNSNKNAWRARRKKGKEEIRTLGELKDKLQTPINKIIRLIDKGLPCLARKQFGQIHAGHVYSIGSNETTRFNLHNIHRQCAQSNHHGNEDGLLRDELRNEYGQGYRDFVEKIQQTPVLKPTKTEIRDLTKKARAIVKRLTEEDKTYTKAYRIELRNQINKELGIYAAEFCEFPQSKVL